MELPSLGKQCSDKTCAQLDFLPFSCTYCSNVYCQEHWKRESHKCPGLADETLDVRVPVCPICQKPVPVNRGEDPNIRVNEHIAAGCANPGTTTTPSPTSANHCSNRGCKARTLVPIYCPKCKLNFCVKHRLEVDHQCRSLGAGGGRARSVSPNPSTSSGSGTAQRNTPAALAAMKRSEAAKAKGTPMSIPRAGSAPPITSGGGPRGREAPAATGGPRGGAPSGASSSAARPVSVATSNTHGATGGGAADALTRVEMERQRKERQQQRLVLEEKARKGLLTEEEQIQIATQMSLERENFPQNGSKSPSGNCTIS